MLTRITFNIGLGNNPEGYDGTITLVKKYGVKITSYGRFESTWEGEPEMTAVIRGWYELGEGTDDTDIMVENIAIDTQQTAIAYKLGDVGKLIYDPFYQGEKYKFNQDYYVD